jgi:UDP-N-acetylglucosamine 2-epimerase (non-hydrolysing)
MELYSGKLRKTVFIINSLKNLIKISPVIDKISRFYDTLEPIILYTGKPFAKNDSIFYYETLGLPKPNIFLNIRTGTPAETTAGVILEMEKALPEIAPDLIVVIGGSSAALGASITAARMGVRIAHIEAGLRCPGNISSTDVNRKLVDSVSDLFFVTDGIAHANIFEEGIPEEQIFFVGNVMVDALKKFLPLAGNSNILNRLKLSPKRYAVLSLHRKVNTCNFDTVNGIISAAKQISEKVPVVFACHKRIKDEIKEYGLTHYFDNERLMIYVESKYPDILALEKDALFLMTDSGTMQVESSVLGIPCLTLRTNTEWIATVKEGTNKIVGAFPEKITAYAEMVLNSENKIGGAPKYWDGQTAERIVEIIAKSFPYEDPSTRKIKTFTVSE